MYLQNGFDFVSASMCWVGDTLWFFLQKKKEPGPNRRDLLHAVFDLLHHLRAELIAAWDWTEFIQFTKDEDLNTRWCGTVRGVF